MDDTKVLPRAQRLLRMPPPHPDQSAASVEGRSNAPVTKCVMEIILAVTFAWGDDLV